MVNYILLILTTFYTRGNLEFFGHYRTSIGDLYRTERTPLVSLDLALARQIDFLNLYNDERTWFDFKEQGLESALLELEGTLAVKILFVNNIAI